MLRKCSDEAAYARPAARTPAPLRALQSRQRRHKFFFQACSSTSLKFREDDLGRAERVIVDAHQGFAAIVSRNSIGNSRTILPAYRAACPPRDANNPSRAILVLRTRPPPDLPPNAAEWLDIDDFATGPKLAEIQVERVGSGRRGIAFRTSSNHYTAISRIVSSNPTPSAIKNL